MNKIFYVLISLLLAVPAMAAESVSEVGGYAIQECQNTPCEVLREFPVADGEARKLLVDVDGIPWILQALDIEPGSEKTFGVMPFTASVYLGLSDDRSFGGLIAKCGSTPQKLQKDQFTSYRGPEARRTTVARNFAEIQNARLTEVSQKPFRLTLTRLTREDQSLIMAPRVPVVFEATMAYNLAVASGALKISHQKNQSIKIATAAGDCYYLYR